MKRLNVKTATVWILILIVFTAAAFTGCNDEASGSGGTTFVKIATGQSGGTYYPIGIALSQVLSENIEGCVSSAMATGGSVDNIGLLRNDEVQIAMIMSTVTNWAYNGEDVFEGQAYEGIRAISSLWENHCQIIVRKDIETLDDLIGKKFVVGAALSGTETDTNTIFNTFGLYYRESDGDKRNVDPVYLNYTEGVDALKNGQVAGVMNVSKAPASTVTDLLSTGDYHILSFNSEEVARISSNNDLYVGYTIPAGTYPRQEEDILIPGYPVLLLADESMSDETVYQITRTMFEHTDELVAAHSAAASIVLEDAAKGVSIPFHNGALRYFQEVGVDVGSR